MSVHKRNVGLSIALFHTLSVIAPDIWICPVRFCFEKVWDKEEI